MTAQSELLPESDGNLAGNRFVVADSADSYARSEAARAAAAK